MKTSTKVALGFRHTGIVVRDMEKALGFYRDLLGLEIAVDCQEQGDYIERLTSVPGARLRIVKLQVGAGGMKNGGMIELLQFLSHEPDPAPRELLKTRIAHVAFTVERIDSLYSEWLKKGIPFNCAPQLSPDGYAKVTYCHDPDGTVVELVEIQHS